MYFLLLSAAREQARDSCVHVCRRVMAAVYGPHHLYACPCVFGLRSVPGRWSKTITELKTIATSTCIRWHVRKIELKCVVFTQWDTGSAFSRIFLGAFTDTVFSRFGQSRWSVWNQPVCFRNSNRQPEYPRTRIGRHGFANHLLVFSSSTFFVIDTLQFSQTNAAFWMSGSHYYRQASDRFWYEHL